MTIDPQLAERLTFEQELEALINRHCKENGCNTPDFILAEYLGRCLAAFDATVRARDKWYGVELKPGMPTTEIP